MRKGSKRSPIQPRTKEQIARDLKFADQRKFIIEKFYPALKDATISVDEASMFLSAAAALVMEEAMETLRTTKMSDVKSRMVDKLTKDGVRTNEITALITAFGDQTLFEARGHFEMMKSLIEQLKTDEMMKRHLDSFTPDWERYLN